MGALKNPIRTLPTVSGNANNSRDVLVEIKEMTWNHVNLWHTLVQPIIDAQFRHWQPHINPRDVRADVGWDWSFIYSLALLHNTATYIPGNQSGQTRALAILVTTDDGDEIPVGMLTVVPEFACTVGGIKRKRTFAWYLADAPKDFYTSVLGVPAVKGVAKALLDCAIQTGFDIRATGETLLHADPNGGPKLADFYVNRCGMQPVQVTNGPISPWRRRHANQYFHLSSPAALSYCTQLDVHR